MSRKHQLKALFLSMVKQTDVECKYVQFFKELSKFVAVNVNEALALGAHLIFCSKASISKASTRPLTYTYTVSKSISLLCVHALLQYKRFVWVCVHIFIIHQKSGGIYICNHTEIIQFMEYTNTIYHLPVHTCSDQDSNANHHNQHSNNRYGEEHSICKTAVHCINGQAGAQAKLLEHRNRNTQQNVLSNHTNVRVLSFQGYFIS